MKLLAYIGAMIISSSIIMLLFALIPCGEIRQDLFLGIVGSAMGGLALNLYLAIRKEAPHDNR